MSGGATRVVMKRNPYFWQVDTDGKQLPYIDQITFGISQDVKSLMLDAISGKIDIQDRHINSLPNKPTLVQNAQKGGYRLVELEASLLQPVPDLLQHHAQRPEDAGDVRQQGFPAERCRSASTARRSSTSSISGSPRPFQAGPRPSHPWYHEKYARQFTDHQRQGSQRDPATGSATSADAQGARLRPDGQKIFFAMDVIPTLYPDLVDTLELVKRHWAELGVDMKVNTLERALYYTRADNNDHDVQVWPGTGGLDPMLDPRDYFAQHRRAPATRSPGHSGTCRTARTAGAAGAPEEAHEAVRRRARDQRPEEAGRNHEGDLRHRGRELRDCRRVPGGHDLRRGQEQPAKTCRRRSGCLDVARIRARQCRSSISSGPDGDEGPAQAGPPYETTKSWVPDRMLLFIVKRLLWMVPSLFLASFLAFVLIELPPGDYRHELHRHTRGLERNRRPEHRERAARALRARPAAYRPVLEMDQRHRAPRRLRPVVRVAGAGQRADLGAHGADPHPDRGDVARHLGHRVADRGLSAVRNTPSVTISSPSSASSVSRSRPSCWRSS